MKAVVFVDVQNDFIDGALRNEHAIEVTPKIVEFAKTCVDEGCHIYATQDTHEKTVYNNEESLGQEMQLEAKSGYMTTLEGHKLPVEHCIEDADGWKIDSRLSDVLTGHCKFITKRTFGSFDLANLLNRDGFGKSESERHTGADEIVLCGFCTDICVMANAVILRAAFPNVKITVMKDLCAGVTNDTHEAALKALAMQQVDIK